MRAGYKPEKRSREYGGKDELLHSDYLTFNRAAGDTLCGIHGSLRVFDAVEYQGQCLWRLPFIIAERGPALGHIVEQAQSDPI